MKRINSYKKGLLAELYAEIYLRVKLYQILEKRYKTPFGEIDVIARKKNTLICIEVKYRPNQDTGLEAVSAKSQKRIIHAAKHFLSRHPKWNSADIRFDIVTISPHFGIRHHINAWYDF